MALAVAGSMSFEGPFIGWVAIHRRHHAFTDQPGDPHSSYRYGTSLAGQLRGLGHAHAGWLLRDDPTAPDRYAPDMTADRSMRVISALFPALCALSLALPFAAGWLIGGSRATGRTPTPFTSIGRRRFRRVGGDHRARSTVADRGVSRARSGQEVGSLAPRNRLPGR